MTESEFKRFKAKIIINFNGCWLWTSAQNNNGYGRLKIGTKHSAAHRLSYAHFRGAIPHGMCVLHTCDVRTCVNPAHLWLGTNDDNVADRVAKGRTRWNPKRGASHPCAKLTEQNIKDIFSMLNEGLTQKHIAAYYGISQQTVSKIKRRVAWKHT